MQLTDAGGKVFFLMEGFRSRLRRVLKLLGRRLVGGLRGSLNFRRRVENRTEVKIMMETRVCWKKMTILVLAQLRSTVRICRLISHYQIKIDEKRFILTMNQKMRN